MLKSERETIINKLKEVNGLATVESFANQLKDENSIKLFTKRMPAVLVSLPVVYGEKSADYGLFTARVEYDLYVMVSGLQTHTDTIEKTEDLILDVAAKLTELNRFNLKSLVPIVQEFPLVIYGATIEKTLKKEIGE